jgi:pyridoxine 5-phosphate synthase
MPRLGVNIDHIATIREIRHGIDPEVAIAALICESAGADSIVAHLREDRRHIREEDIYILKKVVKTKLNLEMAVVDQIVEIACKVKPDQSTLVPEKRQELTTEGGLDVKSNLKKIKKALTQLNKQGIEVSLFIDADRNQIDASKDAGVDMIELHTGRYADAENQKEEDRYFKQLESAAIYAKKKGLRVFAGHGLNYFNVERVAKINLIEELNIGYSIVCRAALFGLERSVKEMKMMINGR